MKKPPITKNKLILYTIIVFGLVCGIMAANFFFGKGDYQEAIAIEETK